MRQSTRSNRPDSTVTEGFTRPQFLRSLISSNPLRRSIEYTEEQLFFLEYTQKYGLSAGLTRIYNETMESMADFYMTKIPSRTGRVIIQVKYTEAGRSYYSNRGEHWPHEFLKNKSISQTLVFRQVITSTDISDIIAVPFMFGSKWCITYGKTPAQLHQGGENALDYRGYFIMDGTPRFTVAHEKIAHNAITTVYSEEKRALITSLKIQDELNISVEYMVYKGLKTRGSSKKAEENTYFLKSSCFQNPIETNKLFKQIHMLMEKLREKDETLGHLPDYDQFMQELIERVSGSHLRHFVLYDWSESSLKPIEPLVKTGKLSVALDELYKKERKTTYEQLNQDLTSIVDYPAMVIRSLFPSIANRSTSSDELNTLHSKAMLLMRMLVANILTEQKVIIPTDRNNVGNKAYLTAPEVFRRDLTRDGGSFLKKSKKASDDKTAIPEYRPRTSVTRGESNVLETLDLSNPFDVMSSLGVLGIPRCSHSRDVEIRGVNESHTGFICLYDTPSNEMVGLTTHVAMTSSFSIPKNINTVKQMVDTILKQRGITGYFTHSGSEAGTVDGVERVSERKLLSINSVPHALIDHDTYIQIRNRFKRDSNYMDTAVIEDTYVVRNSNGSEEKHIGSYNLLCDSARIYRPLYDSAELIRRGLLEDESINSYLSNRTLEQTVRDGVVVMVFPSELTFSMIATSRDKLRSDIHERAYRYCEIDRIALFGMVAGSAPMINHSPGNRGMHEPAMAKSAITPISTNIEQSSETSSKVLHSAQAAPVTTRVNEVYSRYVANGVCAIMAIAITENNLEDAYDANEAWARTITNERDATIEVSVDVSADEHPGVPEGIDTRMDRYHDMDPMTGLPKIGVYRRVGDAIFAKYKYETIGTGEDQVTQIINKSEFVDIQKDGYVQKIKEVRMDKVIVYRITLANVKTIQLGDKLATRYSQKGVVGGIRKPSDMPVIVKGKKKGLRPDLIFSPMSLTSRATPAVIHELLLGNYAVATGRQVDASAFSMSSSRLVSVNDELVKLGYELWGIETYEHPETKQHFQMMTGVAYVRVLKHTSLEKQKACGLVNFSSMDKIQRQPSKGGPTGAIRGGYMDWDTFAAHSASNMISSMFRDQSDRVLIELCSSCGHLCDRCNRDPDTTKDVYASTHCTKCGEQSIVTTKMPWCLVNIYFQLLSVGVKLSLFPGSE